MKTLAGIIEHMSGPLETAAAGIAPALADLPGIEAILFDVYGTLFISAAGDLVAAEGNAGAAGMAAMLRRNGVGVPDGIGDEKLRRRFFDGIRGDQARREEAGIVFPEIDIREIWRELIEGLDPGSAVEKSVIERIAVEYECSVNPVWPMPGFAELFDGLAKREKNLALGIVSNAQFYTPLLFPALTARALDGWGFAEDLCVWSFCEREGKPSPRLFEKAAAALGKRGIAVETTLYVGNDMRKDIEPAAATGFRTALFAGDGRSLRRRGWEPGMRGGPDVIVTDLRQVAECVGG